MKQTLDQLLQFVEENDIKFIRLAFCDMFGVQKKHRHHGQPAAPRGGARRLL